MALSLAAAFLAELPSPEVALCLIVRPCSTLGGEGSGAFGSDDEVVGASSGRISPPLLIRTMVCVCVCSCGLARRRSRKLFSSLLACQHDFPEFARVEAAAKSSGGLQGGWSRAAGGWRF